MGKGSVIGRVLASIPDPPFLSISATTRSPRPGEQDGREYRFVSEEEFDRLVWTGSLLEWAEVFGRRYGTPAAPIESARAAGRDVILEIDVQGAHQVRERARDAVLILLVPPSREEYRKVLRGRLRGRGTESEKEIERRLAAADEELARGRSLMDHLVVNDDLDRASAEVAAILASSPPGGSHLAPEATEATEATEGTEGTEDP